jgi:nicotinate-nucleotide adenylyltransferase
VGIGERSGIPHLTPALSAPKGGEGVGRGAGLRRRRRIGLLGGSFNPAHGGHLHISRLALQRLGLDEVWWLVSPQNPLKPGAGMASFADRLGQAAAMATADTLKALRRRFPHARFVWLMGGDNLAQLPYWKQWQDIFRTVPIAVFARPGASSKALAGMPAQRFARWRIPPLSARRLASMLPPAWVFFHTRLDPRSATGIRGERCCKPARRRDPQ